MEQDPSEQNKINKITEELKGQLEHAFDDKEELAKEIDDFILRLEIYKKHGLVFNKEKIADDVRKSLDIQDQKTFIAHLLKALEPITILMATKPEVFEKIRRERILNDGHNIELSKVLYMDMHNNNAFIHLPPSVEYIKENGLKKFIKEIENGLIKLAEIIESNDSIKKIVATSWIVAKNPGLLERLGFTIIGPISEEVKRAHFSNEPRPVFEASMSREDFLIKYLKK